MSGRFGDPSAHTTGRSSRSALAALMASVGSTGHAAAAREPGLLALVDQHAAAVRDSLYPCPDPDGALPDDVFASSRTAGRRGGDVIALAGYAEGVRDAAIEHGWQPPTGEIDWSDADWVLVRLLAVCALARDAGV